MSRMTLAMGLWIAAAAHGGSMDVHAPQDGAYTVRVTSLREARFATTMRQKYDFSCGSAALATLLTYHYGQPVSEQEVFTQMYSAGDRPKIGKQGFSLLDMKRYLTAHGYQADGFEQPVERLAQEGLPAIVLLSERGYRHFVVVKGLQRGRVLVGDPATGTRAMSIDRFHSLWVNRILFVIHNRRDLAKFNVARDWRIAPSAPLGLAIDREDRFDTLPIRHPGSL
jgi:predicted double-glycine peptidase